MDGFEPHTYGDAFADVYDDWYRSVSDIDATVALLVGLADGGAVLELGVGTGRLAIPLAETGCAVVGVDASEAMLDRLREADPRRLVETVLGDMVAGLPERTFSLAFVAYNTIFNLTDRAQQQACFDAVAARLTPGGRFVVEAFVPDDPPPSGDDVSVRTLTADTVILSISRHDPGRQRADGQFVEFTEAGGVRLRPWSIRYAGPDELDAMATSAGFTVESRFEDAGGAAFDPERSTRHLTVYRLDRHP